VWLIMFDRIEVIVGCFGIAATGSPCVRCVMTYTSKPLKNEENSLIGTPMGIAE
jgi:hypothetical protein